MSTDEAKTGVRMGVSFGSLYPLLTDADRDDFRRWFVRDPDAPNLSRRPKPEPVMVGVGSGYTGNACPSCGSVKMLRAGTCECCQDCGDSTSCG